MFASQTYASVRRPLAEAETLPSHCYTDPKFFARERSHIFTRCWHFAGRLDEIDNVGDTLVVDTVAGNAIVVRDSNANVTGFINACRHRGTRLLDESMRCRHFVCPYHSWTYALDGTLRGAPGMQGIEDFDRADFGLQRCRVENMGRLCVCVL